MDVNLASTWALIKNVRSTLKAVASPLEKLFFRRAYEISSMAKYQRDLLGRFTHSLTDDIEYDLHWGKYYLGEEIFCPLFWISSRSGRRYSKVVLAITASGLRQKFQCPLTLYDLGQQPIRTTLPSIPLRVLKKNIQVKDGRVFMPYEQVEVKLVELWDENGQQIAVRSHCLPLCPIDRLEVAMGKEQGDVEKWGKPYNLEFLEREIQEEQLRLKAPYFMARRLRDKLKREVFSWMWVARISFWRKNLIRASQLSKQYVEYAKWHQKVDERAAERRT